MSTIRLCLSSKAGAKVDNLSITSKYIGLFFYSFLKRGQYTYPLDIGSKWHFVPLAKVGDQVEAAAWLGPVSYTHLFTMKSLILAQDER